MKRDIVGAALALGIIGTAAIAPGALIGGGSPREDIYHAWAEDTVFTTTEVRPGVFFAVGRQGQIVGANSVFIVTDRDVIVVDDHITPTAARGLLAEIHRVTPKPVRYVINTHFHYDHTSGNGVFGPDVEILSHPSTRARLLASGQESIRQQLATLPATIATLRARRDTTHVDSVRTLLDRQIRGYQQMQADYQQLTVVLPSLTVDSSLVLYRGGGQELRVFSMGRGHTEGDIVVQMPREGLMLAGDLLTNTAGPPFMVDGYAGEWGATLRRLARLDFTTTLSGHGNPVEGKERYTATADFMDGLWQQVGDLARRGVPRDSVAMRLDLSRYTGTFPALRNGINPLNVQRAYDLVTGRAN
jgi:glyoxylase-like metal-dependent hydrolase (beta-lactamase superfamily II)